jgi:hypothetical protein
MRRLGGVQRCGQEPRSATVGRLTMTTRGAQHLPKQWAVGAWWPLSRGRGLAHAEGAATAPLERGERRMLSMRDTNGGSVVATDRALYHQHDHQPGRVWTRLGWEHVDRADWDSQRRRLILTGLTPDGLRRTELHLADGVMLMSLARERIRWTTLLSGPLHLSNIGEAHVTVRREPAAGALLWVVRLHPGVDRDDPRLSASVDAAIAWLRAQAGV